MRGLAELDDSEVTDEMFTDCDEMIEGAIEQLTEALTKTDKS